VNVLLVTTDQQKATTIGDCDRRDCDRRDLTGRPLRATVAAG
jgi:hypothetical protein